MHFVANLSQRDTVQPVDMEELAAADKAAAPQQPSGPVIIIGAGPAGLAAAVTLKRNGVEVVVLEARDRCARGGWPPRARCGTACIPPQPRALAPPAVTPPAPPLPLRRVGGRVHTYQGEGLAAPVDLGASIITGTRADLKSGAMADPSTLVAAQLGVPLHSLNPSLLPLYDTRDGRRLEPEVDSAVERCGCTAWRGQEAGLGYLAGCLAGCCRGCLLPGTGPPTCPLGPTRTHTHPHTRAHTPAAGCATTCWTRPPR
jgi:hypothetical protein